MQKTRKTLLVTGASGTIGSAIAIQAATRGYEVCVHYCDNGKQADTVVNHIIENGGKAFSEKADIADQEAVKDLFKRLDNKWPFLSAVVNNAGISGGRSPLLDITPALMLKVMQVNFLGAFYMIQYAVERMGKQGKGGAIVNISTKAVRSGGYQLAHYVSSKGALEALSMAVAPEIAEKGIRINVVSPGIIGTEEQLKESPFLQQKANTIPLQRIGHPDEVAKTVLWLLSEDASYITGAVIPVTGGQ